MTSNYIQSVFEKPVNHENVTNSFHHVSNHANAIQTETL